ncbi:MAG: glucose 1-dehydrogenase [Armatimonadetes bacterium]|nr:glucose 1-dehydrogenase [Armatimonadota bacterium]
MGKYQELNGKSVIVTGAGRGIGLAIARRFVEEGCKVMLTDISRGESDNVIVLAERVGSDVCFEQVDISSKDQVEAMIERAVRQFGRLDIIVNNAGIGEIAPLIDVDEDSYDRQMAVNAKGTFLCATAAARQMLKQGRGGRIINNASGAGKMAPGKALPLGVYAMSKHAVIGLTKALGHELAADNILVNCVCAGIVDTPMWDLIDRETARIKGLQEGTVKAAAVASIPIGRIQQPEDIANMIVWLASDDASYVAAQALNCCGGLVPY